MCASSANIQTKYRRLINQSMWLHLYSLSFLVYFMVREFINKKSILFSHDLFKIIPLQNSAQMIIFARSNLQRSVRKFRCTFDYLKMVSVVYFHSKMNYRSLLALLFFVGGAAAACCKTDIETDVTPTRSIFNPPLKWCPSKTTFVCRLAFANN